MAELGDDARRSPAAGTARATSTAECPCTVQARSEDTFVPPEPPPLPRLDLVGRLAWGCTGRAAASVRWVLAPARSGPAVVPAGVVAFVAGFLTWSCDRRMSRGRTGGTTARSSDRAACRDGMAGLRA